MTKKWNPLRRKFQRPQTKEETDCFNAGYHAFRARIYPDGNVYRQNWQRNAWLRGYRLAERHFNEEIRRSRAIEQTLALEEQP